MRIGDKGLHELANGGGGRVAPEVEVSVRAASQGGGEMD